GLDAPVVEFARDPGPLHRHGTGTQPAQAVYRVNRRSQLLGQVVKQAHFRRPVSAAPVEEEEAATPLTLLAQRDRSREKRAARVASQEVIGKRAGSVNQAVAVGGTEQQLQP